MDDLISRQTAIDVAREELESGTYFDIPSKIEALPAVQPATNCSEIPNGSDDTISRRAALDMLDEQIKLCNKALSAFDISLKDEYAVKVEKASLKAYKEQLENMPSAQPNIIRCKDCKHRDKYGCCKYWKGLAMGDIPIATDDYDFCSYAKRI